MGPGYEAGNKKCVKFIIHRTLDATAHPELVTPEVISSLSTACQFTLLFCSSVDAASWSAWNSQDVRLPGNSELHCDVNTGMESCTLLHYCSCMTTVGGGAAGLPYTRTA